MLYYQLKEYYYMREKEFRILKIWRRKFKSQSQSQSIDFDLTLTV